MTQCIGVSNSYLCALLFNGHMHVWHRYRVPPLFGLDPKQTWTNGRQTPRLCAAAAPESPISIRIQSPAVPCPTTPWSTARLWSPVSVTAPSAPATPPVRSLLRPLWAEAVMQASDPQRLDYLSRLSIYLLCDRDPLFTVSSDQLK